MARTTRLPAALPATFGSSTSAAPAPTAATVAVAKPSAPNKRPTPILIYPTVTPESIVIPIVSCIFGFPVLALTVICCLRRRAKLARERARRRNCDLDRGELSLVRVSPLKARARAVSLARAARPLPALELDTVLEERSDPDQTTLSQVTTLSLYHTDLDRGELSLGRVSPLKARARAVSLVRVARPLPALELNTVLEERSDPDQTTLSQVTTLSNYHTDLDSGELSLVRVSPLKARARAVSLVRVARPLPALELNTVLEERSDPDQTTLSQVEMTPDREVGAILFSAVEAMGSAAATAAAAAACARDS